MNVGAVNSLNFGKSGALKIAQKEAQKAIELYKEAMKGGNKQDIEAAESLIKEATEGLKAARLAESASVKASEALAVYNKPVLVRVVEGAKETGKAAQEQFATATKNFTEGAQKAAKAAQESPVVKQLTEGVKGAAEKTGNKKVIGAVAAAATAAALAGGGIYLYNKNKDGNNAA